MDQEPVDDRRDRAIGPSPAHSSASSHAPSPKDHFLQLMFFQASHGVVAPSEPSHELASGPYAALRHLKTQRGDRYVLPSVTRPVRLDSPAIEVMTDLCRVGAVTIGDAASIGDANRTMTSRHVRALFIVDDARHILGI